MNSGKRKAFSFSIIPVLFVALGIFVFSAAGMLSGCSQAETVPVTSTDVSATDTQVSPSDTDTTVEEVNVFSYGIYNIGDTFTMGTFEQDNDTENGAEPIEWLVIDKSEDAIFVVTKYAIFPCQYHKDAPDHYTTWEESRIRAHLNTTFMTEAFTAEELPYIRLSHIVNNDNHEYNIPGGNDTDDYIFFLSYDEVCQYFPEQQDRKCAATPYAIKKGAFRGNNSSTYWWLRTPGKFTCNAQYIFSNGVIYTYGSDVGHRDVCARPAMWINFVPEK